MCANRRLHSFTGKPDLMGLNGSLLWGGELGSLANERQGSRLPLSSCQRNLIAMSSASQINKIGN